MAKMKSKKGATGREAEGGEPSMIVRVFEGIDVVDRLLARASAEVDGRGAIARFTAAIAEGKKPPEVFPTLFAKEPRFGGPEEALRLYGNLFGIWDRLERGDDPEELGQLVLAAPETAVEEEEEGVTLEPVGPSVELPPRGSVEGKEVPYEVVEGTWQLLASMPPRERTRRQDRYGNLQSELSEWARMAEGLSGVGQETLEFLCFELAEMFDHAFDRRFGGVSFRALEEASPLDADRLQPYAADYVAETLDEAEDEEDEALSEEERLLVESYARRAIAGMTAAIRD